MIITLAMRERCAILLCSPIHANDDNQFSQMNKFGPTSIDAKDARWVQTGGRRESAPLCLILITWNCKFHEISSREKKRNGKCTQRSAADKLSLLSNAVVYLCYGMTLQFTTCTVHILLCFFVFFLFRVQVFQTNDSLTFSYFYFLFGRYMSRQALKSIRKNIRSENTPCNTPFGIPQVNWNSTRQNEQKIHSAVRIVFFALHTVP